VFLCQEQATKNATLSSGIAKKRQACLNCLISVQSECSRGSDFLQELNQKQKANYGIFFVTNHQTSRSVLLWSQKYCNVLRSLLWTCGSLIQLGIEFSDWGCQPPVATNKSRNGELQLKISSFLTVDFLRIFEFETHPTMMRWHISSYIIYFSL